jgi:hypothetical protein
MRAHYDVRLVCQSTGELEATEDWGFATWGEAVLCTQDLNAGSAVYTIVACNEPKTSSVHDVDVAYYLHQRDHEKNPNAELIRYVGVPTEDSRDY